MQPLAAIGLAGNILQFLNFTRDTISDSHQIRTCIFNSLKEYADLEDLTSHLKDLSGRLQASSEPADLVLEQLSSRCREVAEELLEALESLRIKGKPTRFQSIRKTLMVLWGRTRLRILEERLAGFRHELNLHITVDLRSRFDVLESQQTQSFQALDHTTKEGVKKILDVLHDYGDHLLATTDAQTRQLSALHAQNESILDREFKSATVNLVEQSQATRTVTANEHEKSRTETLNAIADAAYGYDDALSTEAGNICARIEVANESTQAQITETMDKNQAIMKQEIIGLQRGLRRLQLEIDGKTEELKEIMLKIDTTPEGPHRKLLRKMGTSATVVLMSLIELYKALQEMVEPIVHRARIAFGMLFRQKDDHTALEHSFELEINDPQISSSLPLYYAFYYQPLIRNFRHQRQPSEVFPSTRMESWIHRMQLTPSIPDEASPEAHALFDLAKNGDELVWTVATLVAGLDACLTPEEAVLVLSAAFSICYDPRCVLPANETWLSMDIPARVALFFDDASTTALQRPRYGLDCTLGRRLKEDYLLLSLLANKCGLQEEVSKKVNISYEASTGPQKVDLTLTLVALVSQPSSWQAFKVKRGTWAPLNQRILFDRGSLWVDASASLVIDLLYAIQSAGLPVTINEYGNYQSPPLCRPTISNLNDFDRERWYQSKEYNYILKTRSWWPDRQDYLEWIDPSSLIKETLATRNPEPELARGDEYTNPTEIIAEIPQSNTL